MSSGSILPTFGAAPPDIRRAPIPRELQPGGAGNVESSRGQPDSQPAVAIVQPGYLAQSSTRLVGRGEPDETSADQAGSGRPVSVAAFAVIAAQADEGNSALSPAANEVRALNNENGSAAGENAVGLTDDEQAYANELKAIDREVRAHEAAHAATGGGLAGRPTYEFVTGPDGVRYAVSGSVKIDTSAVGGDPSATIRKLETVRRAALAPAKPSGQDRSVAAQAEAGIRAAQTELNAERADEHLGEINGGSSDEGGSLGVSALLNGQVNQEDNALEEPTVNTLAQVSLDLLA